MAAALGLDIGTTNLKAVLVDPDGQAVGRSQRELATSQRGAIVEQDADAMWRGCIEAVRELTSAHPDLAAEVGSIGVCSQYSSIVPVDKDIKPVGPMVMWGDKRGTDHSWEIMGRDESAFLTWIDVHGIPTIGGGLALAHILFMQHDRPEIHSQTAAYLEPMDYVTARLTGRVSATQHSMFMSQLCDNRTLGSTTYDSDLIRLSGVDESRLPPLIGVDDVVGELHGSSAGQMGLPSAAVVYAGSNDTAVLAVASGVARPGRGGLAIGTTSVLLDSVARKDTDLDHEVLSMPGLASDRYLVFAENGYGGRVVEYMLDQVVYAGDSLADHSTKKLFTRLDDALSESPPGAGGALFLPWLGGSLAPSANPNVRGGFINVCLETRRVDLVRSVTEGVAHNLAWLMPYVEAFTGDAIEELAFVGGAARSTAWTQLLADILNKPVRAALEPETAVARSVARLALARSGSLDRETVEAGVELTQPCLPQTDLRPMYDVHQEQFQAAFEALRPINEAINAFHGDDQ
jgi:sugar (pentulose or hexulose) kinase